ncbi:Crp/Fnr family transcriptional regulator [Hassallia byssoidea VB512170]|uniref:Crp/Fnr family transcriptional regulator n=1 Tax=Hassallia byssoidea VB512170 TaxID=1304833 RepID=A0A846HDZ3_9CYAN|nr:Crp/Fnr family transcriptional regulator [Hassalia byssoidea]NEU75612.1 Crp/Fnr family transcriptional regulator [Hassalia byssoidea VB512170]
MYEPFYAFLQELFPEFKIDFRLIEPLLECRKVDKGEFLFQAGDICEFVGFTLKGCLRTFLIKDGKEFTLFFHCERQTLGDYKSFQSSQPTSFFCQAIENSQVLLFNYQAMLCFEEAPEGQRLLRLHAESLAFMLRDKLLSLFMDTPEERYLNLFKTEPQLLQRIPQYYLASYLGIEPESLSRLKRRVQHRSIS